MPCVPIKYVVSFTTQDEKHPVNNLIGTDVFKKWLCNPQDRMGVMEAVFQLEYPCNISYINLGSIWCASIEVKVGMSDWPAGREFETLIYTVSLMTPADCSLGRNYTKTEMFTQDAFCSEVAKKKWDRLKVICRQPYKKTSQFGLSFLHVKTAAPVKSPETVTKTGKEVSGLSLNSSTVSSIKQHFLGKTQNSESKSDKELKSKLLKIAASSDNGGEAEGVLSRTAKLVLAASKGNTKPGNHLSKTPDSVKRAMYSNHLDKKYGPQFEEEVGVFLSKLSVNLFELDNITLADVRHRFERKIRRKLTKEEKKIFADLTTEALSAMVNKDSNKNGSSKKDSTLQRENTISLEKNAVDTKINQTLNEKASVTVESRKTSTPNQKPSFVKMKPGNLSTPNEKTPFMTKPTETRKVTPASKRKLNSCDDVVTPPTKKLVTDRTVPFKQKMKCSENSPNVLKAKQCVNDIINLKQIQKENFSKSVSLLEKKTPNDLTAKTNVGTGNSIDNLMTPEKHVTSIKERSTITNPKKSPLKDSSFGEFLLNVTLTQSDMEDDDNDDEILFPKQKVSKRGKGRGRGRRKSKSSSQIDPDTSLVSPSTPSGRGRGKQQRGRGRGKQTKAEQSSSINSMEVRPTGFAKCDGCGDYYGAELLPIHQQKCVSWKNKQNMADNSDSPWLCTRPETQGQRSPPWVMAALAAERRLNGSKGGDSHSDDIDDEPSSVELDNVSNSVCESSSRVIEEQRKVIEQFSKFSPIQGGKTKSHSSFENESVNGNIPKRNQSNSLNQQMNESVSRNISTMQPLSRNHSHSFNSQSVSRDVSNNQSDSRAIYSNQSSSSIGSHFDLTMSDDDSRDSLTENMVECPLCGTLLPSSVIEVHAAHCGL